MELIRTPRLTLRAPELNDTSAITRAINDWEIVRWLSRVPYPYRARDAVEFVEKSKFDGEEGNAFRFVIVFKDQLAGGIGLERNNKSAFELGYWVTRQHWGKGIATEAVSAIIKFAFEELAVSRIIAFCREGNHPSEKVLLKNEFSATGTKLRFSKSLGKKEHTVQFLRDQVIANPSLLLTNVEPDID